MADIYEDDPVDEYGETTWPHPIQPTEYTLSEAAREVNMSPAGRTLFHGLAMAYIWADQPAHLSPDFILGQQAVVKRLLQMIGQGLARRMHDDGG